MNHKQEMIELLTKENKIDIEFVAYHYDLFNEVLRDIRSRAYFDDFKKLIYYFDFMVSPIDCNEPNAKRIHVLSLILDFDFACYSFPGKKLRDIIPLIDVLNNMFYGYIKFYVQGGSLIEIEYLYKTCPNKLWYVG